MRWSITWRNDPRAAAIADRHYNRQTPGHTSFAPPGRCLVLRAETEKGRALWITSWPFPEFTHHEWPGAWVCSAFRNEGAGLSSELVRQAVAVTRWYSARTHTWGAEPELGFITFVNPEKVRSSNPGYCYQRAGWSLVREADGKTPARTKVNKLFVLQQLPEDMPAPAPPANPAFISAPVELPRRPRPLEGLPLFSRFEADTAKR